MRTTDLQKDEFRLKGQNIYNVYSSFRKNQKEAESFYSYRRDKDRFETDKERQFLVRQRPLLLPPLETSALSGQTSKQVNRFAPVAKEKASRVLPRHLPKIETRTTELEKEPKNFDIVSRRLEKPEETMNEKLPPLTTRTLKPMPRAALTSSATLRGLKRLKSEDKDIFRFRFSNYNVKDINVSSLNEFSCSRVGRPKKAAQGTTGRTKPSYINHFL